MTYLAILEPGEDGSYGISFPDLPGCFSYGENLTRSLVPCPTSSPHARIPKNPEPWLFQVLRDFWRQFLRNCRKITAAIASGKSPEIQ
ncbi:type II toxin-antitoxin system HicB family antitoxin [uncultured Acetatifactor sp.]|uniref:type II toxin-antitoxin system HicB family antitoxin n=1 Tax=uncultured Acetatifactor sp. TaxID=1671927 RepID=UPI0026042F90|nr:type II toxin-antitoxin system HicB family antitoxin [uncultured Acetatifactor sp.]